jgi:phosphoribosylanthranilate isomerase
MKATLKPRVKVCCISTAEEAQMAIDHGASALGLVSQTPSGPGVISDDLIAQIAATVPPCVSSFLLTSKHHAEAIIEQQRRTGVNTIQIVDRIERGGHRTLRSALPGIHIVQVIHIAGQESIDEAIAIASHVDALLLDCGNPDAKVKELGGTGKTHDWSLSSRIRVTLDVPVFLAGGLTPENVVQAIRYVRPFVLDVCSGVRTDGKLDEQKLSQFFAQVSAANRTLKEAPALRPPEPTSS